MSLKKESIKRGEKEYSYCWPESAGVLMTQHFSQTVWLLGQCCSRQKSPHFKGGVDTRENLQYSPERQDGYL